jgi:hypothetical protein
MASPLYSRSIYERLDRNKREIRLTTIDRTTPSSPSVDCRLQAFELDKAPQYEALSYVWGDQNETEPIILNGTIVKHTTNLVAALNRLRQERDVKYIWIDAICIDQNSTEEKNYQVSLMRDIYSKAEGVIMWVGEESKDSTLALSSIEEWGSASIRYYETLFEQLTDEGSAIEDNKIKKLEFVLSQIDDPFDYTKFSALSNLFQRQYWKRVWIIQEVALSQKARLICGKVEIDFWIVRHAFYTWRSMQDMECALIGIADQIAFSTFWLGLQFSPIPLAAMSAKQEGISLLDLVQRSGYALASDPRDKIYGLLGLIPSGGVLFLPDYSLVPSRVYTDFVISCIRESGKLLAICLRQPAPPDLQTVPGLPSWVPDIADAAGTLSLRFGVFEGSYHAAGWSPAQWSVSSDFSELRALGIRCDVITGVEDVQQRGEDIYATLLRWWRLAEHQDHKPHPCGLSKIQVFFLNIVKDVSRDRGTTLESKEMESREKLFRKAAGFAMAMLKSGEGVYPISTDFPTQIIDDDLERVVDPAYEQRYYWEFTSSIMGLIPDSAFFISSQGYMAIGPRRAEKGDVICVLLGYPTPLILRPVDSHYILTEDSYIFVDNHYVLIGDSYIYGMMQGEIVREAKDCQREFATFRLR